jgi:ParB family chromosome partitioning protein
MNDNSYKVIEVDINEILPNRFQPRIQFDEEEILELSDSIKEHGVIQPLVVRTIGDKYEIIAGERRYKASVLAGKDTVPVIIKNLNDKDSAEIALIENIQRKNLTPIEEALSYKKILDMGYITQENLALKLGKSQSSVANKIRLLNLSDEVQEALLDNKISERHARSLLRLKTTSDQNKMLNKIINERLTVRKTDEEIDKLLNATKIEEKEIREEKGEENMNNEFNQIPNVVTQQPSTTFDIFGGSPVVTPSISPVVDTPTMEPATIPSMPVAEPMMSTSVVQEPVASQTGGMQFDGNVVSTPSISPVVDMPVVEPMMSTPVVQEPVVSQMGGMQFDGNVVSTPSISPVVDMPTMEPMMSTPVVQEPMAPQMGGMQFDGNVVSTPSISPVVDMPTMEPATIPSMPVVEPMMSTPIVQEPIISPIIETPTVPFTSPIIESAPTIDNLSNQLASTVSNPTIVEPTTLSQENRTNDEFNMPDPIIVTDYTKQYDPIMPTENIDIPSKVDFKEVISAIRECSKKIEKYGYRIDVEEYDLSTLYQVVFKIEK